MNPSQFAEVIEFIKSLYPGEIPVPLHAPRFLGNEKKYLNDCIDTSFVSYVGAYVTRFEAITAQYTNTRYAVAMVNGTSTLLMGLLAMGVEQEDEIITQSLTFVATCNAIRHAGAYPVFVDVEKKSLGLCPVALAEFLHSNTRKATDGKLYNKLTGRKIGACIPMHTLGQMAYINEIAALCEEFNIPLFEDSAEALGSFVGGCHAGSIGQAGVLSYNGNKPVTCGGGGMLITNDEELAAKVRHLSTTAKTPHPYLFNHDEVGFNLRMPNLNAAVGCAQMESFSKVLASKRELARIYSNFFSEQGIEFVNERDGTESNYWLNGIFANSREQRDEFLQFAIEHKVQARPVWTLMSDLPMYKDCAAAPTPNAHWLEDRIISLPSSFRPV